MQDPPDLDLNSPTADPGPSARRRRKRKVKRSVRIKKKALYVTALIVAWLVLLAVWYYLVNRPAVQPPS